MNERYTDRCRNVIDLAHREAERLRHECVDSEHLLLGIIRTGRGVATNVLERFGVSLEQLATRVEQSIPLGDSTVAGTRAFTRRARQMLEDAKIESGNLDHNYVGTEHLLLGLLHDAESPMAQLLGELGVDLKNSRQEIVQILGPSLEPHTTSQGRHLPKYWGPP